MKKPQYNVVPNEMKEKILEYWDSNPKLSYNQCGRYFDIHPIAISHFIKSTGRKSNRRSGRAGGNSENYGRREFIYMTDEEADQDLNEHLIMLKEKEGGDDDEIT